MDTFENWYTNILEEVATAPTKTLAGDVDTIISSLDTLVKELTEELDSPEFNELNEADGEGPSKVWQWIWWMPKARKAQQKVNKIKLNVTDMEGAAEDAKDTDQRAKIKAKAEIARDQAGELQKMVDDKFNAKGELVAKALHNEKIAGQIASIQRATGLEDDPEKVASYKEKMVELKQKYKEDLDAIKALEPSEEEQAAEIKQKQKEKKAAEKLAKKQASASESLVNRANEIGLNELAIEIESKLDWQLHEGTALHQKYDEIIKKAEYTNTLNESKYQTLSVKDRFSRLL
jgi:hypothetical protein